MNLQKSLSQINSVLDNQKLKTKEKIKKIKKHNFLKGMIKQQRFEIKKLDLAKDILMDELEQSVQINEKLKDRSKFTVL